MTEQIEPIVPLLPLRGMLVFPTMVLHLDVGREQSVQALEKAMLTDQLIFLTTQKDVSVDNPGIDDIFEMGTLTKVKQMLKLPNGTIRVLVEGLTRAKLSHLVEEDHYLAAHLELFDDPKAKRMLRLRH